MGRKPHGPLKLIERANVDESTVPSVPGMQLEPNNSNPSLQPESSKQPANSTLEGVEPNLQMQSHFAKSYSRKTARQTCAKVRRSERLKNSVVFTHNQDLEHVIEEITLIGGEEGDGHADTKMSEHTSMGKNLEEKVDYILEMLEAQGKTADVKFKATKNSFSGSCSGGDDITYKSLYIDSQKKYEKGNNPMASDVLEKFNEILLSSLSKIPAREAGLEHRTPAKRKTLDKQTRKN
ncbi:PREDICTED: uncharacterized protein LOC105131439 isoform X2 [Populus euphratica]|uniref:Uncharacterized protein LOC105131439 isoform X2 n=1 Tax=Populus euphratica TaxID=75702 RepID=A0AAJ6UP19_POPEU|nr:PREDICTED: uncharacterized protein LOC105131439 isoform X2 [Populus euphratica]